MTAKETKKVSDSGGGVEIFFFSGVVCKSVPVILYAGCPEPEKVTTGITINQGNYFQLVKLTSYIISLHMYWL